MERKAGNLKRRIQTGEIRRQDVVRRLAELAFGRVNDCVRLALEEGVPVEELDLSLLSEVKRDSKGMVEVKLMDRMQLLEQLAGALGEDGGGLDGFLEALRDSDAK